MMHRGGRNNQKLEGGFAWNVFTSDVNFATKLIMRRKCVLMATKLLGSELRNNALVAITSQRNFLGPAKSATIIIVIIVKKPKHAVFSSDSYGNLLFSSSIYNTLFI